jgi:hypothetical protein
MTRKGKIGRLPQDLREELNRRLENGESGGPKVANAGSTEKGNT